MSKGSEMYYQRFGGIARLYGNQALASFAQAQICVVGLGGVGSWAAEALARTGIGYITLVDMDDVCITNTNRQIHATVQQTGRAKTQVMAERILTINPHCQVTCIDDFITPDNVAEILDKNFSYVIDAIDSVRAKAALLFFCRRHKIPVIATGGAGGQCDPTRIRVTDLANTIQDPLAARLRATLKRDFHLLKNSRGKLGIDCVFSCEPLIYPQKDNEACTPYRTATGRMDCASGLGAVTMVTATFGFVAVSHALKKMLRRQHSRVNPLNYPDTEQQSP